MERNNETFLLLNTDRCVTCGQRFIYIDIPNNKLAFISDYMLSTYWKEQRLKKLNRTKGGIESTLGIISIILIFGSLFFLSSNLTGYTIANLSKIYFNSIGTILFITGLIIALFYFKR